MGVDYEQRVDFARLRDYRLGRAQAVAGGQRVRRVPAVRLLQHPLHDADLDRRRARRQDDPLRPADPRHGTRCCGTSARRSGTTSCTRPGCRPENCRAGMLGLRGAVAPTAGLMADAVARDQGHARRGRAWPTCRSGVDIVEPPFLFEMQRQGLTVVDAQQLMLDARRDQVAPTRSCCSTRRRRWSTASTRTSSRC